jgi:hypothetical protein
VLFLSQVSDGLRATSSRVVQLASHVTIIAATLA